VVPSLSMEPRGVAPKPSRSFCSVSSTPVGRPSHRSSSNAKYSAAPTRRLHEHVGGGREEGARGLVLEPDLQQPATVTGLAVRGSHRPGTAGTVDRLPDLGCPVAAPSPPWPVARAHPELLRTQTLRCPALGHPLPPAGVAQALLSVPAPALRTHMLRRSRARR